MSRRSIRHRRTHRAHLREDAQAIPVGPSIPFMQWLRQLVSAVFTGPG